MSEFSFQDRNKGQQGHKFIRNSACNSILNESDYSQTGREIKPIRTDKSSIPVSDRETKKNLRKTIPSETILEMTMENSLHSLQQT